jgi:hypothetical protein
VKYLKFATLAAGTMIAVGAASAPAFADSGAVGGASDSPGVVSGNVIQAPLDVPVNACGDTVDVIGLLNPAFGSVCANVSES